MAEAEEAAAALVAALEQATLMAKHLPNPNPIHLDQSQFLQIYSSLQTAHHNLSLFLSRHPQPTLLPAPPPENSVSSAVGGGGRDENDVEPMLMDYDDDNDEYNSKAPSSAAAVAGIDGVEERMRDCFIQNKRPKRPLSPSSAAEQRRSYATELAARSSGGGGFKADLDPEGTKLRSLNLIYQFHG